MFIANYGKSVARCEICKGLGCSYCQKQGFKERKHLLISKEQLSNFHIQVQQHLKEIKGEIINE